MIHISYNYSMAVDPIRHSQMFCVSTFISVHLLINCFNFALS